MNKTKQVRGVTTYIIGQGASKSSGPTQHLLVAGQSNECHPAPEAYQRFSDMDAIISESQQRGQGSAAESCPMPP